MKEIIRLKKNKDVLVNELKWLISYYVWINFFLILKIVR